MNAALWIKKAVNHFYASVIYWMAKHSVLLTRLALGVVFLWFGAMKFLFPNGESEQLAATTISKMSGGLVGQTVSLPLLCVWECAIGLGLLSGMFLRTTIVLLLLQMPGTFLPLILLPSMTWVHAPYEPTLVGQYIIKNIVLICAGILIGGTMYGGRVDANQRIVEDVEES